MDAIQKAERLKSRRYRNRRLGDYLKELQLSEGRGTGIPTIQDELRRNGSSPAVIETNEDRSYFLIEIPCREGFESSLTIGEAINGTINGTINGMINEREQAILIEVSKSPNIKKTHIAEKLNLSVRTLSRSLQGLSIEPLSLIEYQGSKKTGGYVLTEKGQAFVKSLEE